MKRKLDWKLIANFVHKIVKNTIFPNKFLIVHLCIPESWLQLQTNVRDLLAITQFNQFPSGKKLWWRKLLDTHLLGYKPVWVRSLQLAIAYIGIYDLW